MIKESIAKLVEGTDLSEAETAACMEDIMSGKATPAQIAAFLTALKMKGETVDELTGLARVMRSKATPLDIDGVAVDTCGTGGDRKGTFNISTAVALVVAGAGIKVAKHGNKASSSHTGSADVLKLLGVNIEANPQAVVRCVREANIGFIFAPLFHSSMKFASEPRRELGFRTAFNLLGPLTNPVRNSRQLIGVFSEDLTDTLAHVLRNLGTERALVVHGLDGLDEITTSDRTKITELKGGDIKGYYIQPEQFGIERSRPEDLTAKNPEESARAIRDILDGHKGPRRDVVLLNTAAAIMVSGAVKDMKAGLTLAAKSIDSGCAKDSLQRLIEVSWKDVK
ncbi:MAG TPA: anthranilate phosphoribosyltransferase [Candidatus Avalokitesvara rifleensis]|uniref:anthranilate phosphoribosyltransferase n=1 Tax=Candidatus Avalokitesvara rifleensis TaxID=3367620 RepID=UPI004028BA24